MKHILINTKSAQDFTLKKAKQFWADESAAVAIEYGLISALISILLISAFSALGDNIEASFVGIAEALQGPPDEKPISFSMTPG